jgi:glycosyltransferase involved in cell wall biosynthesis
MQALIIAPQPFFSPRGTPFSVYYRALVTAELGVDIHLLTYGEGRDVDIPGMRIFRIPRFRWLGNVKTGPSFLKLFLDGFLVLYTIALLLRHRYDVVHAHEEAVFFARFLKPLFGFKLVYDMHSSLPEQLTNFSFTQSRMLTKIFQKLEDSCLHTADAVITICPALADYVERRIEEKGKHMLIENSIFDPVRMLNDSSLEQEGNENFEGAIALAEGRQVIVYAGTLEPYQGIDTLLEALAQVVAVRSDVFLVIVGGTGSQVKKYKSAATENGIGDNCLFAGAVSPETARRYNQLATVLVSPRLTGLNTPLKIYEQLASGIPLVATNIYAHTQVLDDTVSFLVEPTAEGLARGILDVLTSNMERNRRVANAKRLYTNKYSRSAYVSKVQQLLERLM